MSRVSAALIGSLPFALAAGACAARALPGEPLDRIVAGAFTTETAWLLGMLLGFSAKSGRRAWGWVGGLTLLAALGVVLSW